MTCRKSVASRSKFVHGMSSTEFTVCCLTAFYESTQLASRSDEWPEIATVRACSWVVTLLWMRGGWMNSGDQWKPTPTVQAPRAPGPESRLPMIVGRRHVVFCHMPAWFPKSIGHGCGGAEKHELSLRLVQRAPCLASKLRAFVVPCGMFWSWRYTRTHYQSA